MVKEGVWSDPCSFFLFPSYKLRPVKAARQSAALAQVQLGIYAVPQAQEPGTGNQLMRGGDMPNEQNLIPMDQRSESEARELGREGGRASGVSRRRKRSLKEAADLFLSLPVSDKRSWNKIARAGVDPEDVDNQMAIIVGLSMRAAKGDAKAAKVLFDLLGPNEDADAEKDGVKVIIDV